VEVRRGQYRYHVAAAFVEAGQDLDEVTVFLRRGGDEDLIFQQLQQMGREWPCLDEFAADDRMLRGGHFGQPQVF
jgi:hypothetical protein